MRFQLGGADHEFVHEWQAIDSTAVPKILGNDFWTMYKAKFDFGARVIEMTVGSKRIEVPFTVGDEHEQEEERLLCSMIDMVVPPRTPYLLPTLPHDSCGRPARLNAHEVWHVQVRSDEEDDHLRGELQRAEEQESQWDSQSERVPQQADRPARLAGVKTKPRHRQYARPLSQGWEESTVPESEQSEHNNELKATLTQMITSGTAETVTSPKWHEQLGTAVVPVNGINTTDEPMIIRAGERVAVGCRMASATVALLQQPEPEGDPSVCEEGTVVKGMRTAIEHDEGDWRRGLSWKQVVEETKQADKNTRFLEWAGFGRATGVPWVEMPGGSPGWALR